VFIDEVEEDIRTLDAEDALPKPQHFCYGQDEQYTRLMADLAALKKEMETPKDTALRDQLLTRRDQIIDAISDRKNIYTRRDNAASVKERIDKLERDRETLGQEVIHIQGELSELQEYTAACCSAMEERINSMFRSIQWQLFEPLKNGGFKPCCEARYKGVKYSTNLNNAARINAGIEAVRVLSRSAGKIVPMFVDNAEAVNNLSLAAGQMLRLSVSNDEKLTMILEG
jgi:hypothetical protein